VCVAGARWAQEVLAKRPAAPLKVYAVWFEMMPGDAGARPPLRLLADPRVEHFWDAERRLGTWFGAHAEYGAGDEVWWDIWLLYGPGSVWSSEPSEWLGQGRTVIDTRQELAESVDRAIAALPAPAR
jgi:hypothetical protein